MDKVQIYYIACLVITYTYTAIMGIKKEESSVGLAIIIGLALQLPVMGRIFNWW